MTEMRLPTQSEDKTSVDPDVAYELLDLPLPLEALLDYSNRTEAQGLAYTEWARRTEPERVPWFIDFIAQAGGPSMDLSLPEQSLASLTSWATSWLPHALAPWRGTAWDNDIHGNMIYPGGWDSTEGSRSVVHLTMSLGHDLGFLIVTAARWTRPELVWTLCRFRMDVVAPRGRPTPHLNVPTLSPSALGTSPFREAESVITRAVWSLPMRVDKEDRRWIERQFMWPAPCDPLLSLYAKLLDPQEAVDPWKPVQGDGHGVTKDLLSRRRFGFRHPADVGVEAPGELVSAVAALRRAGWLASVVPTTTDDLELAKVLAADWVAEEGEDLQVGHPLLWEQLLSLDEQRTLAFDPESDVVEGAMMYRAVIHALGTRSDGLLNPTRVKEDWRSSPGDVLISFRNGAERVRFRVADLGDYVDPTVISEINQLLPPAGPQFYFLDNDGQTALVTRATPAERTSLQALTPVRLREDPPSWWAAVCDGADAS